MRVLKWFRRFRCLLCRWSELWFTGCGQWACERSGHAGVVWYNPNGFEPDMHCKRCGKDLG